MSTHALHQAFWSAMVAGQTLTLLQFMGLFFGVAGVFSISFFDHLASKVKIKRKISRLNSGEDKSLDETALIVVCPQNDFCDGSMRVPDAASIFPIIERIRTDPKYSESHQHTFFIKNCYPENHCLFDSNNDENLK